MTTTDPVEAAFQAFLGSSSTGVWPKLTRKSLINQLQLRYENPYSVDQRDMYLCGPAAVVFVLFLKYPARSVQICQSLFEKGEIGPPLTSSKTIKAAEALRERDLPPGMSQVDWMLIATLREAENLFFTVDPQASKLAQMAGQVTTQARADTGLDVGFCELTSNFVGGLPARAVDHPLKSRVKGNVHALSPRRTSPER
jgi:hypothetical protein